jgi:PAS domain S-box-containing protein
MPGVGGVNEGVHFEYLDAVSQAALITDRDCRLIYVNAAAERLLGLRRDELLRRRLPEEVLAEDHRDAFREVSEQVLAGHMWQGELNAVHADGSTVPAEITCASLRRGDQVVGLVCAMSEAGESFEHGHSAQRLAERLTGLARVNAELAIAEDLDTVTKVVISEAADAVGATVGSLSLLVDDDTLTLAGLRGGSEGAASRWTRYSVHDQTPAGDVARSGETLVLLGRDAIHDRYPRLERAAEGERSMIALPLRMTGRTIGVVTWSFPGRRRIGPAEMEFFGVVADSCAQAIERIRAQQESVRQAARVQFLADATTKLSESLDYSRTLGGVARMAVPRFADWCAIDLVEDDRLHRLAVKHVDPEKVALAVDLEERYPASRDVDGGAWTVVRTGQPLLVPEVTDEMIAPSAHDEEHLRLLRLLQLRSVLLVPLIARGDVLGVMTWVMAESDRRYDGNDLPFAADLGRRAAIAIDNSRLHTETLEAAVRLQRAVLPELTVEIPGWEIGTYFSPAGRTGVGGDFFDVISLPGGQLVLFVGDVMGRGVRAAAAMAQMRAAVRAYVAVDPDPKVVLARLDRLFLTYDVGRLVTMVYILVDSERNEAAMLNAGHPPPVVRRHNGRLDQLPSTGGAPLGIETGERELLVFPLHPGDLLLAFTDGLIERRDEDIDAGQRRLLDAVPTLHDGNLPVQLERLVEQIRDTTRSDDVAAVAVRRRL